MAIIQIKTIISLRPRTVVLKWKDTETGKEYNVHPCEMEKRKKAMIEATAREKEEKKLLKGRRKKPKKRKC